MKRGLGRLSTRIPEGTRGKDLLRRGSIGIEERYYGNARIFRPDEMGFYKKFDPSVSYMDVTRKLYEQTTHLDGSTRMQYVDLFTWLRGDILVKADKMTMANSLELRVPFLDTVVFDVGSSIPTDLKITKETTKFALRRALELDRAGARAATGPSSASPCRSGTGSRTSCTTGRATIITSSQADELIDKDAVLTPARRAPRRPARLLAQDLDAAGVPHLARDLRRAAHPPGRARTGLPSAPVIARLVAAAAALLLAGCTSSSAGDPAPQSSTSPSTTAATSPPPRSPAAQPRSTGNLYVSVGDSYAAGFQPTGRGTGRTTTNGFAYQAVRLAHARGYHLRLVNFGCGGATTTSVLHSPGCVTHFTGPGAPDYTQPQADAAVAYRQGTPRPGGADHRVARRQRRHALHLGRRHGRLRHLGASRSCAATSASCWRACARPPGLPRRSSARPIRTSSSGKALSRDAADQRIARLSVLGFRGLINPALQATYASVGGKFADVTAATGAYIPLHRTTTLAPYGTVPVAVADVCRLTYFCQYEDIHPRTQGYAIIARLVADALPAR